jgi:hypothetical protein
VDGSTFTVGPNSNLVIDRFVYDPRKKTGQVVATFSKGAMRFVGGKISKNEGGVTVKTPAGALAIRGGMFQASLSGNRGVFSFLFGNEMRLGNQRVFQPGYTIDTTSGTPTVRPTTRADINGVMAALTNSNTNGIGSTETEQPDVQPDQLADTISLQDLISDATETRIVDSLEAEEKKETPTTTTTTTTTEDPSPPDPVQVTFRVLGTPGAYTAFPNDPHSKYTTDNGSGGVLGGGNYGNTPPGPPLADDFTWTFSIVDGRFVGTVSGLLDANCTDSSCQTIETHTISQAKVDFPASFPAATCEDGICPVTNAKITQDGVTRNYAGIAVLKQDFFAYQVMAGQYGQGDFVIPTNPNEPDPLLLIGGTGHQFEAPSGKIHVFQLTQDITQPGSFGPFASANSTPESGIGSPSALFALEQDGGSDDTSRPVWLQSTFVLGGGESEGESFINIALGEWNPTDGISGSRRGGSDVDGANYSFSGDIASLAGPDDSHFLGTENPNIVIGADSTGSHDIFRDTPLNPTAANDTPEEQSGATYHIGIGTQTLEAPTQTSGDFNGYAAGFVQRSGNGSPDTLVSNSPNDVMLSLDAEANTMTASLKVGHGAVGGHLLQNPRYNLKFGGEGNSAFIDDNIFAAFETPGESTIKEDERYFFGLLTRTHTYTPDTSSYFVSADAINANAVLFPGQTVETPDGPVQKRAFCQDCSFIKWGAWGARMNYENYDEQQVTDDVHLGWWIAGDIVPADDLPTFGEAYYEGDAIGTVSKLKDGSWNQYVATGDMDMNWNFQNRSGRLDIANFDNKSFGGPICGGGILCKHFVGNNHFVGVVGNADKKIGGSVAGSFVGPNPGGYPKGVIGNFDVFKSNDKWRANGIFGGTQVPR